MEISQNFVAFSEYMNFTKVVYISSRFWLLAPESHDLSQAEKEITACKAEWIHKMTIIFIQNDNLGPFWEKTVVI